MAKQTRTWKEVSGLSISALNKLSLGEVVNVEEVTYESPSKEVERKHLFNIRRTLGGWLYEYGEGTITAVCFISTDELATA